MRFDLMSARQRIAILNPRETARKWIEARHVDYPQIRGRVLSTILTVNK